MKDPYEGMTEDQLTELAEKKQKEVWDMLGFEGDPTMICMYCNRPCVWDKDKDIIYCKLCHRDWTLESMRKECERLIEKGNNKK